MNNNLCEDNDHFRDISRRLVSMLPSIDLSDVGELGIVSIKGLIKIFGSLSGVGLKVQPKFIKCLAGSTIISWFGIFYHPQHILAQNSKVVFC